MKKPINYLLLLLSIVLPVTAIGEIVEGEVSGISIVKQEFKIGSKRYKLSPKVIIEELYNTQQKYTLAQIQPGSVLRVDFSASKIAPIKVTKVYLVPQ